MQRRCHAIRVRTAVRVDDKQRCVHLKGLFGDVSEEKKSYKNGLKWRVEVNKSRYFFMFIDLVQERDVAPW